MKINISVFDVLGAIIPGIPIIIIIFLLKGNSGFSTEALSLILQNASLEKSLLFVLASYFIGFVFQYPSYEFFKILIPIWGKRRTLGLDISIGKRGKEISKIRENAKENYKTLEMFLALRIMCYNSFFSMLIFSIIDFVLIINNRGVNSIEEWSLLALTITLMVLTLRRAVSFHEWAQNVITDTEILEIK